MSGYSDYSTYSTSYSQSSILSSPSCISESWGQNCQWSTVLSPELAAKFHCKYELEITIAHGVVRIGSIFLSLTVTLHGLHYGHCTVPSSLEQYRYHFVTISHRQLEYGRYRLPVIFYIFFWFRRSPYT